MVRGSTNQKPTLSHKSRQRWGNLRVYNSDEIDVLAAYIVPVGAWYLFPVEEFRKYGAMTLFPQSRRRQSKFERFREAWWIFNVETVR